MKKLVVLLFENLLQLIYFAAFEAALYFGLQYLLFNEPFTQDTQAPTIVPRWGTVMYFILLYVTVVIAALLLLGNLVPRKYKHQVMRWFWLALVLFLPFLVLLLKG